MFPVAARWREAPHTSGLRPRGCHQRGPSRHSCVACRGCAGIPAFESWTPRLAAGWRRGSTNPRTRDPSRQEQEGGRGARALGARPRAAQGGGTAERRRRHGRRRRRCPKRWDAAGRNGGAGAAAAAWRREARDGCIPLLLQLRAPERAGCAACPWRRHPSTRGLLLLLLLWLLLSPRL